MFFWPCLNMLRPKLCWRQGTILLPALEFQGWTSSWNSKSWVTLTPTIHSFNWSTGLDCLSPHHLNWFCGNKMQPSCACRASTWAAFGWAMPLYGQFLRFLSCCWLWVWMYVDHGWWLVKNRHCHSQRLQVRSPLFIRGFAATHDHWFHGHLARVFLHAVTWLPMTGQAWGCCCCCCSFVFELIVATISGTYLNHDPCNSKVVHCTIQNWLAERFKTGWPNDSKLADRTVQ